MDSNIMADSGNALAYAVDGGPDMINLHKSHFMSDGQRWQYSIHRNGALLTSGNDLRTSPDASAREALASFASFLGADAEKYQRLMGRPVPTGEDGYIFGDAVAEWAYGHSDELSLISIDE